MDKVCYNGKYIDSIDFSLLLNNRAFRYGDAFFETIKCFNGYPLYWEEHYFRIAGSFHIMKMNVPLQFDLDHFKNLINKLLIENKLNNKSARIRISFFRSGSGYYLPENNVVDFLIESESIISHKYQLNHEGLELGLYKDNLVTANHLSSIKNTNRLINVLAAIYSKENNFDESFLLNTKNNIIEVTSGNVFILLKNNLITPPISEGCIDGVLRKVLLKNKDLKIQEKEISISDVLNSDEVFITNVIIGVKWVKKFKNKLYVNKISSKVIDFLNQFYLI